jgi:hypothetical protein
LTPLEILLAACHSHGVDLRLDGDRSGNTSNRYPPDSTYEPDRAHAGGENRQIDGNVLPLVADPGEDVV